MNGANAARPQVPLEIRKTDIESSIEELQKPGGHPEVQATAVSPILEALLRNVHGQTHWGLNE